MSRPWTLEGLMAARVLVAAQAPLTRIGFALDRTAAEVDLALWALVGRTPQEALERLIGDPESVTAQQARMRAEARP